MNDFLDGLGCPFEIKALTECCNVKEESFEGVMFEWNGYDLRFEVRPEDAERFCRAMECGRRIRLKGA